MADRVRAAPARKRAGARRPAKKKRRRRPGIIVLALLAALILGFLTKRVMIPSAVHYIAYRAPDQPQPPAASQPQNDANDSAASTAKSNPGARASSEQLTPGDRRELDAIIKRKSR
ncbi:MAG TPA: hypothetical protein VKG68_10295 [Candidatus Binatus sp.]|nr:hypothetical protein [Candidatus Binatus sp.]